MEVSEDNEIIPEKKFDTSFRTPRKRASAADSFGEVDPSMQNSILNYYQNQGDSGACYPVPQAGGYNPNLAQTIYSSLAYRKEKPKSYKPTSRIGEIAPDATDASLPRELTALFQPLYCKLCTAQLSSNIVAKMHYKSKNHEKKVRKFLVDHSEKTGEPLHKRAKVATKIVSGGATEDEEQDPRWFKCETCDLALTGKLHAESHYMGKNHQMAILGKKAPAGKGFYNKDGKWVRKAQTPKSTATLIGDDDTFGESFRQNQPTTAPIVAPSAVASPTNSSFRCDLCNVACTCQQQLDMHFAGQKHRKKCKQMGISPQIIIPVPAGGDTTPKTSWDEEAEAVADNILSSLMQVSVPCGPKNDLSKYRTPSGQYYCQQCNLTMNSEQQLKQHLQSKTHNKKK